MTAGPDAQAIIAGVTDDGWAGYSRACGVPPAALRRAVVRSGLPMPVPPTPAALAARRRVEQEQANVDYLDALGTRVYHDWFTHEFDDIADGGAIIDPSGRFAATFGFKTVEFRGLRPVDTVAVEVELLSARYQGGRPPILHFVVYDLNALNKTLVPRPYGPDAARGARWNERHPDLADHLHEIALCVFDEFNPHAGLLEDLPSWLDHQAAIAEYDRMHGAHIWYC